MYSILKSPSAWLPLAMSCAALAFVIVYVTAFGIVRNADEGAPARLFQLLMAAQVPVIGFFALRWLPQKPMWTLGVLALQLVAALVPVVTIAILER